MFVVQIRPEVPVRPVRPPDIQTVFLGDSDLLATQMERYARCRAEG
jgi:hypothetical protein